MKLEKITKQSTKGSRWYDDACGTAHALELVGERWALLIMRELMLGPRRFGDLRAGLPGLSANVLTQRLEGLEAAGVARRRKLPPPASVQVYELTDWGMEAEPVIMELGRWAARSPRHDPTLPLSPVSLMLSFRTMFDPARADPEPVELEFRFGEERFFARSGGGVMTNGRGEAVRPDAVLTGRPEPVAGLIYDVMALDQAEAAGLIIDGDRAALVRFARAFALPAKAG